MVQVLCVRKTHPDRLCQHGGFVSISNLVSGVELELELIQSHMTQKPVLRGEVDARALRV